MIFCLQANFDGVDIPLPFNMEILKWANGTHNVLRNAKVPAHVKFYNIYGTNHRTPHSVWYFLLTCIELLIFETH